MRESPVPQEVTISHAKREPDHIGVGKHGDNDGSGAHREGISSVILAIR